MPELVSFSVSIQSALANVCMVNQGSTASVSVNRTLLEALAINQAVTANCQIAPLNQFIMEL
jgi:hypothetical protein